MAAPREKALLRLARQRRLARLALWWEAVWPRLWPALGVLGVFLVLALAGLFLALPPLVHLVLLGGFLAAYGGAFWLGFRTFRPQGPEAADRRIERESGLDHRPLAALADRPTGDDPASLALWRAHQARMAARLSDLRVGRPRPGLPARDPRALRLGLLVALAAAFVIAGPEAPERLRRALIPAFAGPPAPLPLRIEAWATPPAYTGAAPVLLEAAGGTVSLPAGSRVQLSLSGAPGEAPRLVLGEEGAPFAPLDAGAWTAQRVLDRGGRLSIRRGEAEIAGWTIDLRADAPPVVAFAEPPGRAARGTALRIPWKARDDWGLAALKAEFVLTARPEAAPEVLEIPLPGANLREAEGVAQPDLSAHPWAGLPVRLRLAAADGAGQQGLSETVEAVIPERVFNHPVAKLIVAIRRDLSADPGAREQARRDLDVVSINPEAYEHDLPTFMALRAARARLLRDRRPAAIAEVQTILWDTAVALEEGRAERTARALAQAREALRQALQESERAKQESEAASQDPERRAAEEAKRQEAERRVQELREAIRRHLEALAERLQRENAQNEPREAQQQQQRLMDRREMERRTERMQDAAREGRNQDAERELAELEKMLEQLEQGRVAGRESPERQQRRERGQQQMGVMQDLVRRESQMLDRSHQRAEGEERRQQQSRRQPRPLYTPPGAPDPLRDAQQAERDAEARERQRDAAQQNALRRALGEVMQQFGDLTGEIPEPLGRADQAMREAQEALRQGADPRPAQERAVRELTEGNRQMAQTMRQQFGQQPGSPQDGEGEGEGEGEGMANGQERGGEGQDRENAQGPGRDPLGRRTREAPGQAENGGDTRVPEEAEQLRSRRIQDELRRRGAEKERPPAELDYIDRLLRRF